MLFAGVGGGLPDVWNHHRAPKDGAHHLGSLCLLENDLLIASGCFLGPRFSKSCVSSILSLCVCLLGLTGVLPHVRNHLRPICAPKGGAHNLGSLSSLQNVLLISSGCFVGPCFSNSPVSSLLSLCVCLLALGGSSHMFGITLGTSCAAIDGAGNLCSFSLSETVLQISSGSFVGPRFPASPTSSRFTLCLFAGVGRAAPICLESP